MKATITGINGFIGSSLNKRLLSMGWETFETLRPDADYVFLFGSPSSDVWYKYAFAYSVRETVENFINAIEFCTVNQVKLIYPSSATVYQGNTAYARTKRVLEALQAIYPAKVLALRIFAGYGVGEEHKQGYASTVYQFTKQMVAGVQPEIWGDGKQTRDWIYIEDIVDNIIANLDKEGFVDIGTGVNTTSNDVIDKINQVLGTKIKAKYVEKPKNYVNETPCKNPCKYHYSLKQGISEIVKSLK
jgi:nucleoside-diphosphate-sugar epimerase